MSQLVRHRKTLTCLKQFYCDGEMRCLGAGRLGMISVSQIPNTYVLWSVVGYLPKTHVVKVIQTTTWLYHLNSPFFSGLDHTIHRRIFGIDLRAILFQDCEASTGVVSVCHQNNGNVNLDINTNLRIFCNMIYALLTSRSRAGRNLRRQHARCLLNRVGPLSSTWKQMPFVQTL
jgi:hypothetical protein